jgi:hypothetical protein
MTDDDLLPFSFPAVGTKKVTAAFDGGRLTSDGGVMLVVMAERRLGIAESSRRSFGERRPSRHFLDDEELDRQHHSRRQDIPRTI